LSWPSGSSVNDGIPVNNYLGEDISLSYPSVDSICSLICACGPGCLIYKRDLSPAYRQFPIDPFDYPLLCYQWRQQLYFDVMLPMGLRTAAMACQRITNAVSYICSLHGYRWINYLDDFIGVSPPDVAFEAFQFCGDLLIELGLVESQIKACPPSTSVTCLGVHFVSVEMTMSVTPERLQEIETLLSRWLIKRSASKSELQSLVGKLSFISKCVRQSRLFLSRILNVLRTLKRNNHRTALSAAFRKDIQWWLTFVREYNGVSVIPNSLWSPPDTIFSTDACLTGCGGITSTAYYHTRFPASVLACFTDIHHLEALAILVALRLWGCAWSGLRIQVFCDNLAVVSALNSGKAKDPKLATCLRAIWFVAAMHGFELSAVHLLGEQNRAADLLSRWHLSETYRQQLAAIIPLQRLTDVIVAEELFDCTNFD